MKRNSNNRGLAMRNKWYRPLFNIVKMVLIDIVAIVIAAAIDLPHVNEPDAKSYTAMAILIFGAISIVVVVFSLIQAIANLFAPRRPNHFDHPKPKNYLWMIPAVLVIDALVIYASLKMDEANCTPLPNGSFMFPAVTIMAILVFGVISLVVFIIAIVLTSRERRKRH